MEAPRISVIVPTLNEEKHIGQLIEKLLSISGTEIIISDGGSTDQTQEICRTYPVKFIMGEAGRGRQMNRGAAQGEGDVFFFLHADSDLDPVVFDHILENVARGSNWGCCTMGFDQKGLIYRWLAFTALLRAKLFSSCYGDQGIFCVRKLFFQVGGFPEIPIMEDLVFSRLLRCQQKAAVLSGRITTSARRFQKQGIFSTIVKMQMAKFMFYLGKTPEETAAFYRGEGGLCKSHAQL